LRRWLTQWSYLYAAEKMVCYTIQYSRGWDWKRAA
jgi:hypothetical protein